jgi:23S rRNA (pseudouridine1915-N3)-methyltransferase
MKIHFWSIGKNNEAYIKEGVEDFTNRISKYYPVEWTIIPVPKNAGMMSEMDLKKKEGGIVLDWLNKDDYLVALDERGKPFTSEQLADFIMKRSNESVKNIVFLIGGAFGLDEAVLIRANYKWSLSSLTFPHQLVRLILAEQVGLRFETGGMNPETIFWFFTFDDSPFTITFTAWNNSR